mmetsp:Transcript_8716/g.26233  ORF Transcript_8716/g.26233 Transcript_8716/m.26233 type:complete len:132 (-) Transcript_8716:1369-1764(-)
MRRRVKEYMTSIERLLNVIKTSVNLTGDEEPTSPKRRGRKSKLSSRHLSDKGVELAASLAACDSELAKALSQETDIDDEMLPEAKGSLPEITVVEGDAVSKAEGPRTTVFRDPNAFVVDGAPHRESSVSDT